MPAGDLGVPPPFDGVAEQEVLGCCVLEGNFGETKWTDRLVAMLRPEDFYDRRAGEAFRGIVRCRAAGSPAAALLVGVETEWLVLLAEQAVSPANALEWGRRVLWSARRRALWIAVQEARVLFEEGRAAEVESRIASALLEYRDRAEPPAEDPAETVEALYRDLLRGVDLSGKEGSVSWFLPRVDRSGGFIRPGDFAVVAGRPGTGKTAFALERAWRIAEGSGRAVVFASLEMSVPDLIRRLGCSMGGVADPGGSPMSEGEARAWRKEAERVALREVPVLLCDHGSVPTEVRRFCSWAKDVCWREKPVLLVVDYLGLLHGSGRDEYERVTDVSRRLRHLALETGVAILALHQMNRETEKDRKRLPRMSDLRGSGQIEQDATHVAFLHRRVDETACLVMAKSRHGSSDLVVDLVMDLSRCRIGERAWVPGEGAGRMVGA